MSVPPSKRCGALYHASLAAEATLKYANNNHVSCDISVPLLNQVEGYHREAVQARDNACAGRPLRPFPADIIQRCDHRKLGTEQTLLWQDALPQRVEGTRSARVVLPRLPEKFFAQIFCRGSFFLRNFSAPSMGARGRGGPALCCTPPPRLRQRFVLRIGHLQNFQRLRAPLRAPLRSPRATLAETARIRHLIEINRALGRTSALSVRITCFPTV